MNLFTHNNQIILGTLLGNSKLVSSDEGICLCMRNKDAEWLKSKAYDLKKYEDCFYLSKRTYHWKSKPDEVFNEFNDMLYKEGQRKITFNILDTLRDIAISVWYGDCGCLVGRSRTNACLRTQSFGNEGNGVILEWFNSVGIECNLNKHRNDYVLVFTHKGTKILFKMISPLLPQNRRHLIC